MAQIEQNAYIHALLTIPELGFSHLTALLTYFQDDFEKAFKASYADLVTIGIPARTASIITNKKSCIDPIAAFVPLTKNGIASISYVDEDFPALLQEIPHKPILLYYKGQKIARNELCVAVVGTRKVSEYGKTVTEYIAEPLARHRVTIVSGLAYGVDGVAHQSALTEGGRTIAVVASGLLNEDTYPKAHTKLTQDIINFGGTLISEYPPGTPALKQHFIARNRIISGLSVGTVVIECAEKSGALVTARFALEQNRNVYAVPGSILEINSQGPNNLIKLGAAPITEAEDILKDLRINVAPQNIKKLSLNLTEQTLYDALTNTSVSAQQLSALVRLSPPEILTTLTELEIKGLISHRNGQYYKTKSC